MRVRATIFGILAFKILALTALLFPMSVNASDTGCSDKWIGTWQRSAEGQPVEIFTLKPGTSSAELTGLYVFYSGGFPTFLETVVTSKTREIALSKATCINDKITLEIVDPDGDKHSWSGQLGSPDSGWLMIDELPAQYVSPKYLLRKVPPETRLVPRDGKNLTLSHDLWQQETIPSNQEMAEIFAADQAIRLEYEKQRETKTEQEKQAFFEHLEREDDARLARTTELIESGQLKAGVDYYRAAFIFQHGEKPEDYLRAHHLAVIALSLGYKQASWISAATLDRYLLKIGRNQIYGTQYLDKDGTYQQSDMDIGVVSDAERRMLSVPVLADQ